MRTAITTLLTLLSVASIGHADPGATQPPAQLDGRVTSTVSGLPVAGASVFIATTGGLEQQVTTDEQGNYHAVLHATEGTYNLIFAFGSSRNSRHFDLEPRTDIHLDARLDDAGEVITVHAPTVKPVPAMPVKDLGLLPEYSDRAALGNYWAKAWMLLEVDATGAVTRVKFLKRPGYDLDAIAVRTALATRFTPATDNHGNPTRTQVIWPIEWPAMRWMATRFDNVTNMPPRAVLSHVRCIGDGPLNLDSVSPTLRDCSRPDLGQAAREPWIGNP